MTITLEELRKLLSMPGMTSYRQPVITPAFITDDALGYTGPAPISLTIDDADIQAIREMLGIGHEIERPFTYNELLTPKGKNDLATAVEALEKIAVLFEKEEKDVTRWKGMALEAIQLAQHALESIGLMEADDGTPSDS